jgi:hypothetical protein
MVVLLVGRLRRGRPTNNKPPPVCRKGLGVERFQALAGVVLTDDDYDLLLDSSLVHG